MPLAWEAQGLLASLPPWASASLVAWASGARPPSHRVLHRWTWVPTEGGQRLATELFLPEGSASAPTLLLRLPLSQHPWHQAYPQLLGELWAARGYAVVAQRTRGKGGSEGQAQAMGLERVDGAATWRWLQAQSWWEGRFATFGGSAFGYNQWALSPQAGLQAQLIQLASAQPEALLRPGGAFALASALHWARSDGPLQGAWPSTAELAPGLAPGLSSLARASACQAPTTDYQAWALAEQGASLWARLDLRPERDRAIAPVLLMAGWHDPYLSSQLEDWAALRRNPRPTVREGSRLIVGPWAHARGLAWPGQPTLPDYRLSSLAAALPWFDAWLPPPGQGLGPPTPGGPTQLPRVQAFRRGAERWEALPDWPVPTAWFPPEALGPSRAWKAWAAPGPTPLAGQLAEAPPPGAPGAGPCATTLPGRFWCGGASASGRRPAWKPKAPGPPRARSGAGAAPRSLAAFGAGAQSFACAWPATTPPRPSSLPASTGDKETAPATPWPRASSASTWAPRAAS